MKREILIVEPVFGNRAHAAINAGIVAALAEAYPSIPLTLVAERGHAEAVNELLERSGEMRPRSVPSWEPFDPPPAWHPSRRQVVAGALRLVRVVHRRNPERVVVLASSNMQFFALAFSLAMRRSRASVAVICHGGPLPLRGESALGRLGRRLLLGSTPAARFRMLLLGRHGPDEARAAAPEWGARMRGFELPYLELDGLADQPGPISLEGGPVFTWPGRTSKGDFRGFVELASETRRLGLPARFRLAGHLSGDDTGLDLTALDGDLARHWLTQDEITTGLLNGHFVMLLLDPEPYRFSSSASFFDALAAGRPVIALESRFLEEQFARKGDIGYLCRDLEEMRAVVRRIVAAFPGERYEAQRRTILATRGENSPARVAGELRRALEE